MTPLLLSDEMFLEHCEEVTLSHSNECLCPDCVDYWDEVTSDYYDDLLRDIAALIEGNSDG